MNSSYLVLQLCQGSRLQSHFQGSVRSESTRNENHYILIKQESMYTFKVENVSQRCKRLRSKKLKSVKFFIIAK